MKVAMYYNNKDVRIEEMPIPEIGADELLVKMRACGICGSDVMEWYRLKTAPRVLGHEMTGDIVKVGEDVKGYEVGERVFVSHHVPCDKCRYCLNDQHTLCDTLHSTNFYPGGFSEYIRVPAINVEKGTFVLPDSISYEEGTLIEPLGCVVRGMRIAGFRKGQTVLVIGSGITGLLHVKLARAIGAKLVIANDINEYRLEKALEMGADLVLHAGAGVVGKIKKINDGYLPDLVVTCTGAPPAMEQAINLVGRGGTILFFAPTEPGINIPFPLFELWNRGITMVSTYAAAPRDIEEAIKLLRSGTVKVKDMITHRLPLEDIQRGFDMVADAKDSIKVVIEINGKD